VDKLTLTIENNQTSLDFNEHFANLVRANESLNRGAAANYRSRGMTYVDVPEIVGITGACENVDTLFKIGNRQGRALFFTQTGQLSLEQALQTFPGAWTIIHLRQFRLTEEEFDSTTLGMTRENYDEDIMYEALLTNMQGTVQAMLASVLEDNEKTLQTVYKRSVDRLRYAATNDFLRITYEDAVKLLQQNGYQTLLLAMT